VDKAGGVADKESEQTMPRTHKPYDAAFRQQAVELLLASDKPQSEVARDLGICVETLREWKQQHTAKPDATVSSVASAPSDLERENQRLRRELAYTQRQREILKKALAICAAQPELLDDSH
jgi:transposase